MENKMKSIEKKDRSADLIQVLLDVWEKSVRATHLFLSDSEILNMKEQTPGAKGFYEHMGFQVYKRTENDEQGNPYPLLYMQRKNG